MNLFRPSGALMLAGAMMAWTAAQQPDPSQGEVLVRFETALGTIDLAIDVKHAPISAANFLKYVDGGFYDGGTINRAVRTENSARQDVKIEVIQFQIDSARRREQFAPIPLERTRVTGLKPWTAPSRWRAADPTPREGPSSS